MDDYLSDYDNVDQLKDNTGGVRYMPIEKKSVGIPDYQPLQQNNKSGKTLKRIQRNQKRVITVIVVLSLLLLVVIIVGSTLVSVGWSKLTAKSDSESNYFQNCKQEKYQLQAFQLASIYSAKLHNRGVSFTYEGKSNLISIIPLSSFNYMQEFNTFDVRCEFSTDTEYLEVSTLVRHGTNSIRCQCSLLDVMSNGTIGHLQGLHISFTSPSCILAITRCPA